MRSVCRARVPDTARAVKLSELGGDGAGDVAVSLPPRRRGGRNDMPMEGIGMAFRATFFTRPAKALEAFVMG